MSDETRLTTTCPTCSSPVRVVTADEGTSHYEPLHGPESNKPIDSTYAEVAALLRDMAERVELGDSFEGSIEYAMPEPVEDESQPGEYPEVTVRAVYRIGNTQGQGGVRIVGSINS